MPLSTDPSTLPTRAPVAATKSPQNATRDAERKAPSLGRALPLGKALPQRCRWGPQTHDDDEEILTCLEQLKVSSAGTGFLHESFNQHDVTDFTRPWFAW